MAHILGVSASPHCYDFKHLCISVSPQAFVKEQSEFHVDSVDLLGFSVLGP